jgi:hypothetical protein
MMAVYRLVPGLPSAWISAVQPEKGHPGLKGQQPKIVLLTIPLYPWGAFLGCST